MSGKRNGPLREQAERAVSGRAEQSSAEPRSVQSLEAMMHELAVHEEELELQNENLRQAEAELQVARDRYFGLFDLAPVAYLTLDQSREIREANFKAAALLQVERAPLLGRRLSSFITSQDADSFHHYIGRVVESGSNQSLEVRLLRADGTSLPAQLEAIASAENGGEIRMAIVDLTVLKQREEQIRITLEASPVAILIVDDEHQIVQINAKLEEILGYPRSELIGKSVEELVHPDLRDDHIIHRLTFVKNPVARAMGSGRELFARRKDGTMIPVEIALSPVATPEGQRTLAVIVDLTERRRAESKLRASEARFRQMAERIEDVFYVLELPSMSPTYISPACEGVFSQSSEELRAHPEGLTRWIHPGDRDRVVSALQGLVKGDPFDSEYRILRPNGELRWLHDRAFPIEHDGGRIVRVIGTAQDITEQRQLEEELRQAQKMEAVGQLASGVAHDFNNLLMGVIGCATIAMDNVHKPAKVLELLDAIKSSAKNGAVITKQLLSFARKRDRELVVIDVNAAIAEAKPLLLPLLGESIRLVVELAATKPHVNLDRGRLEQVLLNLAGNARDAIGLGGVIAIETSTVAITRDHRHSPPLDPGDYVLLRVSDSGSGMSEATRQRVFEPFFTTKGVGKGTGLGLSTVYAIIAESRGHIEVKSDPGEGTAFEILLPCAHSLASRDAVAKEKQAEGAMPETILLVEDEPTVLMTTRHYLLSGGYHVLEAANGSEAMETCRSHTGPIDVLLTDMVLPGLDGTELARQAAKLRPDMRVIYMSAHSSEWLVSQGRLAPGSQTLEKPFAAQELLERIREKREIQST